MLRKVFRTSKKDPAPQSGQSHPIANASSPAQTIQSSASNPNPTAGPSATLATPSSAQPPLKDIFRNGGDDCAQSGDYNGAAVMYGKALSYAPTDSTLLLSRSLAHMMTTPPRLDLALADADAAIQYGPTNWQAWLQQGQIRLKMGDMDGAEGALVNAVGFAQGVDKLTAQRSLADLRSQRAMSPPVANRPASSVPSTSPATSPSLELPIRTPPAVSTPQAINTQPAPQASSTTSPATADSCPTSLPALTTQASSNLAPSPITTTSSSTVPAASNAQSAPAQSLSQGSWAWPSTSSRNTTAQPRQPAPVTNTVSQPRQPAPATTTASQPRQPAPVANTRPPASVTNTRQPAPATPATTTASQPRQPAPATNTASQRRRPVPVTHAHDSSNVSQTSTSTVLDNLDLWDPLVDNLDFREPLANDTPSGAPPSYTPSFNNPDPAVRALSQQALQTQLTELETALRTRKKGSISIRPYTSAGNIDAVQLVYIGLTQLELTDRELGTPVYLDPSFSIMAVDAISYPGSTFLDMDCESTGHYEGKLPGTVSISGYSEEYREHQLLLSPRLNLSLESTTSLQVAPLDKIVQRIQILQRMPTSEDNEALRNLLGLSQIAAMQSGFHTGGNRQRQIEFICMGLNRSLFDAPTCFIDFSKARNISNNTLGSTAQGIGLRNFLFQILLGAELLVRLRKEPITTSYAGLMTDATSALVVLSALWMQNVTIQVSPAPFPGSITPPNPQYIPYAIQQQRQIQGLIRFGEALSWPLMDEARAYIENAYRDLTTNQATVGFDICDWLFGLILPGKIFRHRIMSCLVYASPSMRSINPPPLWDNGLVVRNKSYWPKRTVLGRVLGGLRNPKSVCGWIGPAPAPEGGPSSGWIKLNARRVDIPIPVASTAQDTLESLGFEPAGGSETPEAILQSIVDPNEWIQCPGPAPRAESDASQAAFKGINLTEVPTAASVRSGNYTILNTSKEYRASVDFEVNGVATRYTLYSNPVFVSAPPCVGTHLMHRRQATKYLSGVVKVVELKEVYLPSGSLVIIDAQGRGEETVARAWCAESARNAVIRRGGDCCFACAVGVTMKSTGLGVNVLIWSG